MAALSATEIPTPDELAYLIDGIIQQRLLIALAEEETHLQLQKKKLALLSEKQRKQWQAIKKWGELINGWTWAIFLMFLTFSLGLHTGLNILPKGVICEKRESFCYLLRLDDNKRILRR
jgi:hypothetical protein